jgi:hypothetical protein
MGSIYMICSNQKITSQLTRDSWPIHQEVGSAAQGNPCLFFYSFFILFILFLLFLFSNGTPVRAYMSAFIVLPSYIPPY